MLLVANHIHGLISKWPDLKNLWLGDGFIPLASPFTPPASKELELHVPESMDLARFAGMLGVKYPPSSTNGGTVYQWVH